MDWIDDIKLAPKDGELIGVQISEGKYPAKWCKKTNVRKCGWFINYYRMGLSAWRRIEQKEIIKWMGTEKSYGFALRKLAKKEGHKKCLPNMNSAMAIWTFAFKPVGAQGFIFIQLEDGPKRATEIQGYSRDYSRKALMRWSDRGLVRLDRVLKYPGKSKSRVSEFSLTELGLQYVEEHALEFDKIKKEFGYEQG